MKALIVIALASPAAIAEPDRTLLHAEIDPLPLVLRGYGAQIGVRPPALRGVRVAVAQFSLHVPDAIAQIGNDGFHQRVRPGSGAIYALYYFRDPTRDGFSVGASLRYLRVELERDGEPGRARTSELSPELIVGYQWHPFANGFYLQPWLALGVTVLRDGEQAVGARTYDPLPVSPFFTVNVGYEHAL